METIAKPVVKNKFWIVEHAGHKIATIQAVDENGGFVYVHNDQREHFPSIKLISKKYNIEFAKEEKTRRDPEHDMYGFPVLGTPSNQLLDVQIQTMIEEAKVLEQKLKIDSLSTSIESTSVIIKR